MYVLFRARVTAPTVWCPHCSCGTTIAVCAHLATFTAWIDWGWSIFCLRCQNRQIRKDLMKQITLYSSLHLNITNALFTATGSRSMNGPKFSAEVIRAPIMVLPFKPNVTAAQLARMWCSDSGVHRFLFLVFVSSHCPTIRLIGYYQLLLGVCFSVLDW